MNSFKLAHFLLRFGLAFAFFYAAIAGFIDPDSWIGYFPPFMQTILPGNTILVLWGIVEILLGIWLLTGWKVFWPSVIAGVLLLGVVVTNLSQIDILFRDISLALAAFSLAAGEYGHTRQMKSNQAI